MAARMDAVSTDITDRLAELEESIKAEAILEETLDRQRKEQKVQLMQEYYDEVKKMLNDQYKAETHFDSLVMKEKAKLDAKELKELDKLKQKLEKTKDDDKKKKLEAEYAERIKKLNEEEKIKDERAIKRAKKVAELESAQRKDELADMLRSTTFGKGQSLSKRLQGLKDAFTDKDGSTNIWQGLSSTITALADMSKQLTSTINDIASNKSAIDTRLQGWTGKTKSGSYWDQMSTDITGVAGVSPLIKQENMVNNIKTMVGQGIAFNVEQRAFLQTISDKIANTFSATDGTLLKLVRIQQADTTAARLGMESALTAFLNNMYETTEYMTNAASSIRQSLYEASALMGATQATAFEYQVQKWMGSLYSVGFSNTEGLAGALGQLAAGNVEGITNGGYGNLLVMAASNAGLSIGDALQKGLNEGNTNKLMRAMVEYLQGIYTETKDSLVVQQQYAKVFGLTASDLKAISNLNLNDIDAISNNSLGYAGMLAQLNTMANSMYKRTSQTEMLTNLTGNMKYTMAAGIANNPLLYSIWTMSNLLEDVVGGIEFNIPTILGTGTNQTFNIADMMKVGALSGSIINGVANMISAGGNGGLTGAGMLSAMGIGNNLKVTSRGNGSGLGYLSTSGASVSESSYTMNASSSDIQSKSFSDAKEENKARAAEEEDQVELKDVDAKVLEIATILKAVTNGSSKFHVTFGSELPFSGNNH